MGQVNKRVPSRSRLLRTLLAGAAAVLPAVPAFSQTWSGTTDNNWFTATNWSGNFVPNSPSAVVVIDNGLNNPVILNASASLFTLTLGAGDSLNQTGGLLAVSGGSIANSGALDLSGQVQLSGGDLTLAGTGVVTLSGGQFGGDGSARTLFNQTMLAGYGLIGSNAGALYQGGFSLNNSGTIDANSAGNTLTLQGAGTTFANSGLLEATGGGILNLATPAAVLSDLGGQITAAGPGSTVLVNVDVQGGTFTTSAGGVIETGASGATLDGSTLGSVTLSNGSTYTAGTGGLTQALGTLTLDAGATLALTGQLKVAGADLTLMGPGIVSMSGGGAQIGGDGAVRTLFNDTLIQGSGVIGSNVGALYQGGFSLNNAGTINADSAGNSLVIQGGGTFTNTGLLEATGGGVLNLFVPANPLVDAGGSITASGAGSMVLINTQVQGGTLTTFGGGVIETGASGAFLNGATASGPVTLADGSTYTAGSNALTQAGGTLNLGLGAGPGATFDLTGQLQINGADLTLAGPGTLTMSGGGAQIGGDGAARTLVNEVVIQGYGVIGSNVGALYQGGFSLQNLGTIDANSSGNMLVIQGGGADFTNAGLLEATGGGILDLATSGTPLNNSAGDITASGTGSTVLINSQVQGGTLSTLGGGVIETGANGAFLNGATGNGAVTLADGSTYTAGSNALTKAAGTLNLGLGAGPGATFDLTGQLQVNGADLTVAGPGTLTMSGGDAQIGGDGVARTLFNDVVIQGYGVIGSNVGALSQGGFSLQNMGTIDANSSGNMLVIQGGGVDFTNAGLLEATGGGILDLATSGTPLNNSAGDITASGAGSTVLVNSRIEGGNLNSSAGGVFRTGTSGAVLDGSTDGPIALTDGSTYIASADGLTHALGTLTLDAGATLSLTDQFQIAGADLTLSGPGAVMMSGNAQIGGDGSARNLTNDSVIEGSGLIGSNVGALSSGITVVNGASGTILANLPGQTLTIAGTGGLTNLGTLQADAGSTLNATQGFTNFVGGVLSGGAYIANSGNIQINALGATGGEIVTNGGQVVLNGAAAILSDAVGLNALSMLSTNASGASLTVEGGNQLTSAAGGPFSNAGAVTVGSGSTFSTVSDYTQNGASSSTTVDGTLSPGSGVFSLAGGRLTGSGLVTAEVDNSGGVVNPGDAIGTLSVLGYNQGDGGVLGIDIGGAMSNDLLNVEGSAMLGGLLDPMLKGGFTPTLGESFVFLDYTSRTGSFSGIENAVFGGGAFMWQVTYNATDAVLTVGQGPGVSAAPEPNIWAMMIMSIGVMGLFLRRSTSRRRQGRGKLVMEASAG